MRYHPPYGAPDPNAPYVNGNPQAGIQGSIADAEEWEFTQRETINAIVDAGLTPSDNDLTQLAQAIRRASAIYVVDQGTPNSIVVNPIKTVVSYTPGLAYEVKVAATNTGATTINVSSLGTRELVRMSGATLGAGDVVSGGIALVVYDGLRFQLLTSALSQISEESLVHYGVDIGATNALVATVFPAIDRLQAGLFCLISVAHTNTGAATINVSGLGVKPIVRASGAVFSAGDLVVGGLAEIAFDGTNLQLLNVQVSPAVPGGGETNLSLARCGLTLSPSTARR